MNKQGGLMSKQCVLISIRPQWCAKIANGEKTIEVRKTRPKMETPFKCYIYCTNDKENTLFKDWIDPPFVTKEYNIMRRKGVKNVFADNRPWGNANGKIIGEFVCDKIFQYSTGNIDGQTISSEEMQKQSCLTYDELFKYENSSGAKDFCLCLMGLYGWHISDLQIYDKPRELSEFYFPPEKYCEKELCGGCPHDQMADVNGEYAYDCEWRRPITRAPQSWCYVEEYDGKH
jgi:predicted transcriptional regulator